MDLNAYVYGDVVVITQILSQIALIFSGNDFAVAAKLAALIGIVIALWSAIAKGGNLSPSSFIWPILIIILLIIPRVNLVIEDKSGGSSRVDDLPVGFAAPVYLITNVGYGISEMMTNNLGLDSNQVSMDNGHLVAMRAPFIYDQVITDPKFQGPASQFIDGLSPTKDTIRYVDKCLSWGAKSNPSTQKLHQIQQTALADLRVSGAPITVSASNGDIYECEELYDALISGFASAAYQEAMNDAIGMFFGKFTNDTTTGGRYQVALESVVPDLGEFYALAAFSNALQQAPNYVTVAAGGGSHEAALQDALTQRREKNFGASAILFETISQTIAFIEVWSFSIIPLVLLLLLLGGSGVKMAIRYFWMLVWVQLWYPTILIVISYLDASMASTSVSAFLSVSSFNAFMAEMTRLQDVGYLQLSMATALSMMLVLGTSSALTAALQRDLSGREHYDEKKNAPDTLMREPHHSFAGAFRTSEATGTLGVDTKESFAGATVSIDRTRSDGASWADVEAIVLGKTIGTHRGGGTSFSGGETLTAGEEKSVGDVQTTGRDAVSTLSTDNTISQGGSLDNKAHRSDVYNARNNLAISGGLQGSLGVEAKREAPLKDVTGTGLSGKGAANLVGNITGTSSAGHQTAQGDDQQVGASLTTDASGRVSDSATARQSEELKETDTKRATDTTEYKKGTNLTDAAHVDEQATRQDSQSQTLTSANMVSKHAAQVYNALVASNNLAKDDVGYRMMMDLVRSTPESSAAFDEFLTHEEEKLGNTFHGRDAEKSAAMLAGIYVTQGLIGGNLFPNDANGQERMEAMNALSDEIIVRTGFGGAQNQIERVTADDRKEMDPVDLNELRENAASRILETQIDLATAKSAASRTPLRPDGNETFDHYLNELGMDHENLNQGQLNGLMYAYRERLDANRSRMDNDSEDFMALYRDVGLRGAIQNSLWISDASQVRRDAVLSAYDEAAETKVHSNNLATDELNAEYMLGHRMAAFTDAGIATENNDLARFMALTQLEAGAIERGDTVNASIFSAMRQEIRDADPVLEREDTARRVEAFAMTGASSEAMTNAFYNAQNEYALGNMEKAVESRSGYEIRSDGIGISWSSTPDPSARGEMNGGGTTLPPGSAEDIALTYIGSLEGPRGYNDFQRASTEAPPRALTTMTIGEVKEWQDARTRGVDTRAAGRYQITDQAWDKAMAGTGLSDNDLFSAANQDKMAVNLLEHRGFDDFMSGRETTTEFGHELSKEWAILPKMTGDNPNASYYEGKQGNSSGDLTAGDVTYLLERVQNAPRAEAS